MLSNILQVDLSVQEALLPEMDNIVDPRFQRNSLRYGLADHASHIRKYHPDGTGIGETIGCPCNMCERVMPILLVPERVRFDSNSRYLIKASHVFYRLFESMTYCDQRTIQRLLECYSYVSCDTKMTEMGPNTNPGCNDCQDFYSMFGQSLQQSSFQDRDLLRCLLESQIITYKDLTPLNNTPIVVLSHVLYYATPVFRKYIHDQIYSEREEECGCGGCIHQREYEDLYYDYLVRTSQNETRPSASATVSDGEDDNEFVTKYIQPYLATKAGK